MPARTKTEPTVAPGVSNGAGGGAVHAYTPPEAPSGLWAKLQGVARLGAVAGGAWQPILDGEGLLLLYSEPGPRQVAYTLVDVASGQQHTWTLNGNVAPDLALVRLLCLPVPALGAQTEPATEPPKRPTGAGVAPTPAPTPTEPPAARQEQQEDVWSQPVRATTLAETRKLVAHEMLPPHERQRATAYLDREGLTEGQVLGCKRALEKEIAKAILDLEEA